jgi:MarR family transcriptional regulator, 2-MHQ and catechol-resistance regulon repressor
MNYIYGMVTATKGVIPPPKESGPSAQLPLLEQLIDPADQPFVDAVRALLKAGFLLPNHPLRPNHAYDLTLAQIDVLVALAGTEAGETLSCSEIAERTLITKGGITGILDRLEARGLVKRIKSADDRRSVMVRLSAKGVELFRKLYPEIARSNRYLLGRAFKPEQMKEFSKLLEILIHSLEAR